MSNGISFDQPDYLYNLAHHATPTSRRDLAMAVSSIISSGLTKDQKDVAGDILIILLKQAELDLRERLAEKLAENDNTPTELIEFLARDESITVARPVLLHSTVLSDEYLLNLIKEREADIWRIIAQRQHIGPGLTTALIELNDAQTCNHVIDNHGATMTPDTIKNLIKNNKNELIHQSLLLRPEVNQQLATELYWHVSVQLRDIITRKFHVESALLDNAIRNVMDQQLDAKAANNAAITDDMRAYVKRMHERGRLTSPMLIDTVKRRNIPLFVCMISVLQHVDERVVRIMMEKKDGRGFATILRAVGMTKTDFTSLYLVLRSHSTENRITDSNELSHLLAYYNNMSVDGARLILTKWAEHPDAIELLSKK